MFNVKNSGILVAGTLEEQFDYGEFDGASAAGRETRYEGAASVEATEYKVVCIHVERGFMNVCV